MIIMHMDLLQKPLVTFLFIVANGIVIRYLTTIVIMVYVFYNYIYYIIFTIILLYYKITNDVMKF
jgi:hypothetical protein